ncbi:AAA family ATPase [Cobetia sp. 1AS1]|uniref:AAA family ATPase n=1 Tax=Cobetia sp. 1AS1 TaxID=3040016 RepID=UPI002447C862|nr:AAA family ATPase [Cobetia sp. 1AS1]MDH2295170.1 AAA family ATPase [Cobetia sp. 1AS1]
MTQLIKKLNITYFKAFENITIEFNNNQLTVLDGPNGFGKTSLFDAIELLFTGSIKRYLDLERLTSDGRKIKFGCPWLNRKAPSGAVMSIRAEIRTSQGTIYIERSKEKELLDKAKNLKDINIELYSLDSLDSTEKTLINDEDAFISEILGKQYKRNFEIFHYIEQDENIKLLKKKDKERQIAIAHLFEIGEVQEKINTLEGLHAKLKPLYSKDAKLELDKLEQSRQLAYTDVTPEYKKVSYEKLVNTTNQEWDKEHLTSDIETAKKWISYNGEINNLKDFISNFENYEKHLHNKDIEAYLLYNTNIMSEFLKYYYNLNRKTEYIEESERYIKKVELFGISSDFIAFIKNTDRTLEKEFISYLPKNVDLNRLNLEIDKVRSYWKLTDVAEKSYADILDKRKKILKNLEELKHSNLLETSRCVLCGAIWDSYHTLLIEINKHTNYLEINSQKENENLRSQLNHIQTNYLDIIYNDSEEYLKSQKNHISYKKDLISLPESRIESLNKYKNYLIKNNVVFEDLLVLESTDVDKYILDSKVKELEKRIREKLFNMEGVSIKSYYNDFFREVFNSDRSAIKKITLESIEKKKEYLLQHIALLSSDRAIKYDTEYKQALNKLNTAKKYGTHVKKLLEIYNQEKKQYLASIVGEIEIIFYIYSGRIMQSYQQGLGIFIKNNGSSITFHDSPSNEHDVIFSMSSGQLSSLMMSFTLALNKRYSQNDLLLIDDPIQTLDEINIAGLVDLLRTEFDGRQIIISTHEDRMSAYFRYKYMKYSLPAGRINFMELDKESKEYS